MSHSSPVISLAEKLIACKSVTPDDAYCQKILVKRFLSAGFTVKSYKEDNSQTVNLLATHGQGKPFVLFLGHTDVVPPGDLSLWTSDPFSPTFIDDEKEGIMLQGRGSADMKGSDAAMTEALCEYVQKYPNHQGTIGLLVTSNEEGDASGGVPFVANELKKENLIPDFCIVGEPSSEKIFGDTIKVGRRGSLTAHITVIGKQGHVAYPERVHNPIHDAAKLINALNTSLDSGNEFFPATSFELTNIKSGTGAENVVPESCYFMCNWRFNNEESFDSIKEFVEKQIEKLKLNCQVRFKLNGLPFISGNSQLSKALADSILEVTGVKPNLSTSGGTSDGRFIAPLGAKVVEFGPKSATIHQINERVAVSSLDSLSLIFIKTLERLLN